MSFDSLLDIFSFEAVSLIWMDLAVFAVGMLAYLCIAKRPVFEKEMAKEQVAEPGVSRTQRRRFRDRADSSGQPSSAEQRGSRRPKVAHPPRSEVGVDIAAPPGLSALRKSQLPEGFSTNVEEHLIRKSIQKCAQEGDLNSAREILTSLKERDVRLTHSIYSCLLEAQVECQDMCSALWHFEEMIQLGYDDIDSYNSLLNAFVASKDLARIRSMMENIRLSKAKANSETAVIFTRMLALASEPFDVRQIIDTVIDTQDHVSERLLSAVIEACVRRQWLDLLSDCLRRLEADCQVMCRLSPASYGAMLKAYGQAGDIRRVWELWHHMTDKGIRPTCMTMGCMVEALVSNKHTENAWTLVQAWHGRDGHRSAFSTVIYTMLLKGFSAACCVNKALAVYREMRSVGVKCSTVTFNTLLDVCGKCFAMDLAKDLLLDMKNSDVEIDVVTYSSIIKGYCLAGNLDMALQVLEVMKQTGDVPDEILYNCLIDGCGKLHRPDDAQQLFEDMKARGIIPTNYTLSILIKVLGRARRLCQAFSAVEDAKQDFGLVSNIQVFTCLAQACILNRRLDRALAMMKTVEAEGCPADEKFYTVLMRGCLRLHQPQKGLIVLRAAFRYGVYFAQHQVLDELAMSFQDAGLGACFHELSELRTAAAM
eukprot:TRINITY_DN26919_c0_g1_i1.p1 TRINITY_DN26919_c0_g1~~TRINITY_DN26919_c0_g1_i1.p1  ORF type:complete len:651 (-),score=114.84 TRINITY_DN26919_c0_g1_i1:80-2032(-)